MRAADSDRDRTIALLRDATVAGRLTLDEFAGRVERAVGARRAVRVQSTRRGSRASGCPTP
jgi:hypothetical protein